MQPEDFELLSEISGIEPIGRNRSIREIEYLNRRFGKGRWRKLKGAATIQYKHTGRVVAPGFTGTKRMELKQSNGKSNAN